MCYKIVGDNSDKWEKNQLVSDEKLTSEVKFAILNILGNQQIAYFL